MAVMAMAHVFWYVSHKTQHHTPLILCHHVRMQVTLTCLLLHRASLFDHLPTTRQHFPTERCTPGCPSQGLPLWLLGWSPGTSNLITFLKTLASHQQKLENSWTAPACCGLWASSQTLLGRCRSWTGKMQPLSHDDIGTVVPPMATELLTFLSNNN